MKLLEELRYLAFWLSDFVKGSPIRNHYRDISKYMINSTLEERNNIHDKYLSDLIEHAVENCRFYEKYKGIHNLPDFPVVNKTIIKEKQSLFRAKNFRDSKLFEVTTSGSTGTPFKTSHDFNKKQRNYADTVFFAGLAGYNIGQRLIYMKIWVRKKMKSSMEYLLQNIVPVDVIQLNDAQIGLLIRRLEQDKSTFSILGYSSALELICRFLDRIRPRPVNTRVKSIISMSEALNDYTRTTMEKYFRIPVVSRYSNLENGIIAQQLPDSNGRYLVNTASYHIEILDMDSDDSVKDGVPGRIVVTDLFNYALPMIRYDTGDIGTFEPAIDKTMRYLLSVEGRKLDLLFDTEGNLVSSYLVYKNMWQYTEIDQYQLIQESSKQYTFKINCRSKFLREDQLIDEFKGYLGKNADFRVEYVDEIPLLASGKRKKIVSRLIKN
jgi:phenylacetate-CoA ligase